VISWTDLTAMTLSFRIPGPVVPRPDRLRQTHRRIRHFCSAAVVQVPHTAPCKTADILCPNFHMDHAVLRQDTASLVNRTGQRLWTRPAASSSFWVRWAENARCRGQSLGLVGSYRRTSQRRPEEACKK